MDIVARALEFAKVKHVGQFRRNSNEPYVNRPIAVGAIVSEYKLSKQINELVAASYLHDTLEDTDTILEEIIEQFGPMISSIVEELTNDESEIKRIGKLAYHKNKFLKLSNYALVIKLADRLHNISDCPTQKMIRDTIEITSYLKTNRILTHTQGRLVDDIIVRCNIKLK